MVNLLSFKTPLLGLVLMVAYAAMVIDIIGIKKQRTGSDNYPPAVIAMLVAAILQMLFNLWVVATSGKGALGKATTVMGAHAFFFVFQVGATIAATVLYKQRDSHYCPRDSLVPECPGVSRGVMGLGWSLAGLSLIYMAYVFVIAKKHANLGADLYNIPPRKLANADLDAKREAGGH